MIVSVYNKLVNTVNNPALIIDEDLTIVDVNKEALQFFNMEANLVIGFKISILILEKNIKIAIEEVDRSQEIIRFTASDHLNTSFDWFIIKNQNHKKIFYILLCEKKINHAFNKDDDTFRIIGEISEFMPGNFYWKNARGVYLGCNSSLLKTLGFKKNDIIGKTDHDLWIEQADELRRNDLHVMETGQLLEREEVASLADGTKSHFAAIKIPMRDSSGKIIGIIGNSLDITAQKQAEILKFENATQKAQLEAQSKFTQIVNQVAHDIRSPVAALLMIVKSCKAIPERERVALNEAVTRVQDIANNLLAQYKKPKAKNIENAKEDAKREAILVSAALLQLMTEKKFQYKNYPLKFETNFSQKGYFAFICIDLNAFNRMISNLINNSVDAFENAHGQIVVSLSIEQGNVIVAVEDNGKGMPLHVVDKILNHVAVTDGKENGHGLGLNQVRDILLSNQGKLEIDSKLGKGTQMKLWFPLIQTPEWIAKEITLYPGDIIVILDDDISIHGAWDTHFESILVQEPTIEVQHFELAIDTLNFINNLTEEDRQRVLLLTDFELLQQKFNGLDVIDKLKIERSILVTSHYLNEAVHERANNMNTKILPKQLASEVSIIIVEKISQEIKNFMPSIGLQQILAEKKLEYKKKSIQFELNFESDALFTFLQVNISNFKRMVSNIINNAVDACEKKDGLVKIYLKKEAEQLIIIIEDNGKGMSASLINKIMNNIEFTFDKKEGHGIGFTQIRETLQAHGGKLSVISQVGTGTQIQLTFPETPPPKWILKSIEFYADDLVVILDDDSSIHGAWDARLSTDTPNISIKHFEEGEDAIQFINALSPEEKQSVFLLTDYELLNQKYNGLDVIKETQITRSILVTSHFGNEKIQEAAALMNTKILPKLLASDIAIQIKSRGI